MAINLSWARSPDSKAFLEPVPGDYGFAELAGVAGEVVGDERHLWEFIAHGKQQFPGGFDAAAGLARQGGVREVRQPEASWGLWSNDGAGNVFGEVPFGLFGGDFPAEVRGRRDDRVGRVKYFRVRLRPRRGYPIRASPGRSGRGGDRDFRAVSRLRSYNGKRKT